MQIIPGVITSGSIVVSEKVPAVSVGSTLIATVLSRPKGGFVFVSLFGRRVLVETSLSLQKGQVLNLKVHALNPKIVLKPVEQGGESRVPSIRMGDLVQGLVGSLGKGPLESFTAGEIIRALIEHAPQEEALPQFISAFMEQVHNHPQALAYLFVPFVERDSQGHARVSIDRQDDTYTISFEISTDHLGDIECTARLQEKIDIELRTSSEETAGFLREHIQDLSAGLEHFGVRSCEVVVRRLGDPALKGVDVLV